MEKKLLSVYLLFSIFFLSSFSGFGQSCPTSVGITANPGPTICAGTNVTFTANVNGGSGTFTYQWKIDGVNAGTNSNQFPTSDLENGDKVTVSITSADTTTCTISSSSYTMTVNAKVTPTVSVIASKTNICPGESVTFTAANTNGGTSPQYAFYLNTQTSALQTGSSNTYTTTALNNGDQIKVVLTSNVGCVTSPTAETISNSVTVRSGTPSVPGTIVTSVGSEICPGTSQTYSVDAVAGATSYQWTLPSGWSGSSTSTSINITAGTTSGSVSVKAINDCGTSESQSLAIIIKAGTPAVPGSITGTTAVCPGVSETYSVKAVSGATEYIWSLPNGWTGTSTTNSITVNTGSTGGNLSVQAKNECGTSTAKTLAVSVKAGTPATPTAISGTAAVCPGISQTYSINAVTGATSYIWTLPNGWTGTSTTTSITANSGTTGGNITVKAINYCGTSAEQTLAVSIKPGTPATPSAISGSNNVCPGTSEIYSVTNNPDASEYIWTLPNGWTGTSTTSTLTVNTGSSGSGNITVKAKNDCGTSAAATIAVSVKAPAPVMSGVISGPANVCSGSTNLTYSIPAVPNATSYIWTLPNGSTQTSTTNSITVTIGTSGNISVIAKNDCGDSSASQNFSVQATSGVPSTPGTITAPNLPTNAICPPATGIQFNVPTVTGATNYIWTLPSGWEVTSGSGTNAIVVKVNATAATTNNASVSVEAVNICGNSAKSTLSGIAIDNHVVTNAGADQTVCKLIAAIDIVGTYNFSGSNTNLKPTWSAPAGMGSFDNNSKLSAKFTPTQAALDAGSVVITLTTDAPSGACGPGKDEMKITFKPLPTATITATSPICNGNTSTLTFTGTPNSRVTYKLNNGSNLTVDIPASGAINVTTPILTANSTYSLVSSINLDTPACSNTLTDSATITVTPKPTASITYASAPFCTSLSTVQNPTLTGTNAHTGGSYSSTTGLTINGSTGAITPSTSAPGIYTITYSTPAGGGCTPVTATTQVIITKAPTAAISYAGTPFCTSDSTAKPVTLTGTDGFSGGTFSAPAGITINSSTGAITASSSTPGTYIVTYNTPAAGGCSPVTATTQVTITKAPTITILYPQAPFCLSDATLKPVTITGTDAYTGGTYSAPAALSINSSTGEINPSASTVGTHTVTYTSPATSGCGAVTATTEVTITQTPAAVISYAGPFCNNDEALKAVTYSNTAGAFTGGTFSVTTSGLSINSSTGEINAKTSSPGAYTVIYKLPEGNGCPASEIQTQITITQSPKVDISYTTPLCTSDTAAYTVSFTNGTGAFQGGTFTGTTGLSIDVNGNIIPATSTPGVHTITYTTLAAEGCGTFQTTTEVEIFKEVIITTEPVNVGICSTEPAAFEVVASGDSLTYQWKRTDGAAITNATGVNTSKLSFNNATSINAGKYYVEVSGSSPCSLAVSESVTLNIDENIVIIKPTEDLKFCDQERADVTFEFIAHANGAPLKFTWIKDGVDIPNTNTTRFTFNVSNPEGTDGRYTGTFKILSPNPSDNGIYAVRISGPDYFTCSDAVSKTFTLNVTPLPEPPVTADVVYCQNAESIALTASGENGATFKWYDSQMNPLTGAPTPSTSEAGTIKYFVTQTTAVCESNPSELIVTVKPTPAVPTTNQAISYCHNEVATTPLAATGANSSSTLNWYGPDDKNIAITSAPTPVTTTTGVFKYWVSENFEGCESPLVEIVITINPLPTITATADAAVICKGSTTTLRATGGISYEWFIGETSVGTGADFPVSPILETTYKVVGTNNNGCKNTAEITIKVDEPTVVGILDAPKSVCINNPNGTLTLTGYTGEIIRWESKPANSTSTTWTEVNGNKTSTLNFSALTVSTDFRVTVKNGVCAEVTAEARINVDPLPVGGKLAFADIVTNTNDGRIMTICQGAIEGYRPITLTGHAGTILGWKYSVNGTPWVTISGETGNILSADKIKSLKLPNTTVFKVEISSGVCTPNVFSQTAILSVIPTNIEPTPVTVSDDIVCLGDQVTLSSETGYSNGVPGLEGGSFDNAGLKNNGWRFRFNGNDANFETNANNVVPDFWSRATPRTFPTANLSSPHGTSEQLWDPAVEDGNKGFALVSGRHTATMETNVFSIGSMDQALLTFDQAYNLTPGATITVEISRDGGVTYEKVLFSRTGSASSGNYGSFGTGTPQSRPNNKMVFDLGDYLGQNNLRVRFTFKGARTGDIWAVDAITVPQGPRNVTIEWNDYTNPDLPIFIGNTNSVPYIPTKIGLNIFEVKTKLVFDSAGNTCPVAVNAVKIEVFVFDKYTTSVTAEYGSCGVLEAQLTGKIVNSTGIEISTINAGEIVPTPDGYIGEWVVTGTGAQLEDPNLTDNIPAKNDPLAKLVATSTGTYSVSWNLVPTARNAAGQLYANPDACPPVVTPIDIIIEGCIALDFDGVDDYVDLGTTYTGDYSVEAWVKPTRAGGTILSGPKFNVTAPTSLTLGQWTHIAVSGGQLYINGIASGNPAASTGGTKALIGALWNGTAATEYFEGWIEEVRIWNGVITLDQIKFLMNQRLQNSANIGVEIPLPSPGLGFSALAGYYRLISGNPDPAGLVTFDAALKPINGVTIDLATNAVPGVLKNMSTNQQNTAPLPYFSGSNGDWDIAATWARPTVWKIPHTGGIKWNIVKTSHNITAHRETIVLGLLSEVNTLEMIGTNPTGWVGGGTGNPLRISHYLNLDGVIDLQGESQLLQPMGSIVDGGSTGSLQRDQQGTANSYNYNYWSSPVSPTAGGVTYTVAGVLKDGTSPAVPGPITFGDPYAHADAGVSSPINISNYWISIFNGAADQYGEWAFQYGSAAPINVGEGYTMKGTSGDIALKTAQNYTYVGLPNNGTVLLAIGTDKNYLLGNPYPSAIDAYEFINDNLKDNGGKRDANHFDGALYFWDHFGKEDSHVLLDYVGGYASLTKIGAVPAISNDDRINDNMQKNTKVPGRYIPVGQGFFINSTTGAGYTINPGDIKFENDQREFITEEGNSQFLKPEDHVKSQKEPEIEKIRISYKSPLGYYRQILVGAHPLATNGFDLGYDAPLFDYNKEDMYWIQESNWLVIQGVSNFDKEQVLPLGIVLEAEGEFTIKIDTLENMEENKMIYIRDILNDTIHNLTKEPFVATSKGGYINDRFEIIFYKEPPITPENPEVPTEPVPGKTPPGLELDIRHGHDTNQLQISNPLQVDITNVYVYDLNGKLLQTYYNIANEKVVLLPLRNFSSGVYIVKLNAENQVLSKKIIINN